MGAMPHISGIYIWFGLIELRGNCGFSGVDKSLEGEDREAQKRKVGAGGDVRGLKA